MPRTAWLPAAAQCLSGKPVRASLQHPRDETGGHQTRGNGNNGYAGSDEGGSDNDGRADKEFPAHAAPPHCHSMTTNSSAIIAANASVGIVSGLVHSTLRMLECCSSRISFICLRAIAS